MTVDGQLPSAEAEQVEAAMTRDPQIAARVQAFRATAGRLAALAAAQDATVPDALMTRIRELAAGERQDVPQDTAQAAPVDLAAHLQAHAAPRGHLSWQIPLKADKLTNEAFVQAASSTWTAANITNGGAADLRIETSLKMTATGLLINNGNISILGTGTLLAGKFVNAGTLLAASKLALNGKDGIVSSGILTSYNQMVLDSQAGVTNRGKIVADIDLVVRAPSFENP